MASSKKRRKKAAQEEARRRSEREQQAQRMAADAGFEDIDWDAEIWGSGAPDGDLQKDDPAFWGTGASLPSDGYVSGFGSWSSISDPTDAKWDLDKEARHRGEAIREARKTLDKAEQAFKDKLAHLIETHGAEAGKAAASMMGVHADLVIAKVMKDIAQREDDRVTVGGSITPLETKREFIDLGARLYRVLEIDPHQSQGNLDLIAATLDAVSYVHPARTWRELEEDVKAAK